jgi:hypothetical protein
VGPDFCGKVYVECTAVFQAERRHRDVISQAGERYSPFAGEPW